MTPRDFIRLFVKGYAVVLISIVIAIAIAITVLTVQPTSYRASSQVRLDVELPREATADAIDAAIRFTNSQTVAVKSLVTSDAVMKSVIAESGLTMGSHELAAHVVTVSLPDSRLIEIRVTWSNGDEAAGLANAIARRVATDFTADDESPLRIDVSQVTRAVPSNTPVVPNPAATIGLSVFAAVWFSAAWLFVRHLRRLRPAPTAE